MTVGGNTFDLTVDENKKFSYSGTLEEPELAFLKTDHSLNSGIWITSGTINIDFEERNFDSTGKRKYLKVLSITGPAETEKNQWFFDYRNYLNAQFQHLPANQKKDSIATGMFYEIERYLTTHPKSKLSAHLLQIYPMSTEQKEKLLALLNRELNSEEAKRIERIIAMENLLRPGTSFSDFTQPQADGKTFSLSSIADHHILIDFWASDCAPCRRAHPKLIKLYNQFKGSGFEIVSVSFDSSEKLWKAAIAKDRLPWINVSDLKGWNNALAVKYHIASIPFNVLLDKNHKVVAIDLSPDELSKKLEEIFKKKDN
jgi:thiol-disulfide isomerase/thioredoxin